MANELEVRQNNVNGTVLDAPLTSGATSYSSAELASLVAIGSTQFAWVILDPAKSGGDPEIVKITAHTAAATTATIVRAQAGTTARSHASGTTWMHGPVAASDYRPSLLHIQDQKTSGTNGGACTAGSWQIRDLTTIVTNEIGATLASNVVTGLPAGVYEVSGAATAYSVSQHQCRLYNVTAAAVIMNGTSEYSPVATGNATNASRLAGRFTLSATSDLRIEHRSAATKTIDGFGAAGSFGTEIYVDLQLRYLSS